VGDVVRSLLRVGARDDEHVNLLGPEIVEPGVVVGPDAVPAGTGVWPGRQAAGSGVAVVVVEEPRAMAVDVHVADLVAQAGAHQIVGQIRARVGDPRARGPDAPVEVEPAGVVVAERWVEASPSVETVRERNGDGGSGQARARDGRPDEGSPTR